MWHFRAQYARMFPSSENSGTRHGIFDPFLIDKLREILKVNRIWDVRDRAANLDTHIPAIKLHGQGFPYCQCFDNDPSKVGKKVGEFVVEDSALMVERIRHAD